MDSLRQQQKDEFWQGADRRQSGRQNTNLKAWTATVEEVGAGADAGKVKVRLPGEVTPLADLPFAPVIGPTPAVGAQVDTLTDSASRRVITGAATGSSGVMTGEIKMWPTATAPTGYLLCNGGTALISDFPALYAILGTTYGGDGVTTFGKPDFRGRVPAGVGTGDASDATAWALGQKRGEEGVQLTVDQMPAHDHSGGTSTDGSHFHTTTFNLQTNTTATATSNRFAGGQVGGSAVDTNSAGSHSHTISSQGSGNPHENLQPSIGINFIIKT